MKNVSIEIRVDGFVFLNIELWRLFWVDGMPSNIRSNADVTVTMTGTKETVLIHEKGTAFQPPRDI